MIKEMKIHIYNKMGYPLVWELDEVNNDLAVEFDSFDEVEVFLSLVDKFDSNIRSEIYEIKEDILYYDCGYIEAARVIEALERGEYY